MFNITQKNKPVTAVIVGAGHRALAYAGYALTNPERLKIVGVADPNELRRKKVAETFNFSEEYCFSSAEELASKPRFADAAINGTMDHQHVPTSIPLLKAGYHILLEKPFATNEEEMWQLVKTAEKYDRKVMICHVLRYAPFYRAIKERLLSGEIGDIINIQTVEHVSYHHMAVGYVRGKWRSKKYCHTSMLLAKCCHDLDLIMWFKSGTDPVSVASFGGNYQFVREKMPKGAGNRCLVDCPIEENCLYSAKKHYIDHPDRWSFYVWDCLEHIDNPTIEQKIESLKKDNIYGRCVWKCDNDVVDHQSVVIWFKDGSTATHNMIGGASKPQRSIHIIGTIGEIQGVFDDSKFVIRKIDPRPGKEYSEQIVDLNITGDMTGAFAGHGGGDLRLASDFVDFVQNRPRSISCTCIQDSINGHLAAFLADKSMEQHRVVDFNI
ncbi:MAG: Gfo/Idh/MocA family oxidoreductase [Firmicutes bacterium]|nr:Gfo/Idh/MocA family oxidoreductase [Bacillota bacterium]